MGATASLSLREVSLEVDKRAGGIFGENEASKLYPSEASSLESSRVSSRSGQHDCRSCDIQLRMTIYTQR